MALVPKIDPNKIFASNAPTQDKPAAFDNYEKGMDETRKNLGRPTIPQLNYLHQTADMKNLYIHQNGAGLPYDPLIEYAENAVTLKDGELKQLVGGAWVETKTKSLPATAITTASSQNQQQINDFGGAKWYAKVGGYELGATVKLDNGDTVKSTALANTVNPNIDMTGWANTSDQRNVNSDITVTVGMDGQYQSISKALIYLSKLKKVFYESDFAATILLKSGFIASEQININSLDLSWIDIASEDAEVVVSRAALTQKVGRWYSFMRCKSGSIPSIKTLFSMDNTGTATERVGIYLINSSAYIEAAAGFKNAGERNVDCTQGSTLDAESGIFTGAGQVSIRPAHSSKAFLQYANVSGSRFGISCGGGAVVTAPDLIADNCLETAIEVQGGASLQISTASVQNAGGIALYASKNCIIDASGANLSGAGAEGLFADKGARVDVSNAIINDCVNAAAIKAMNGASVTAYAVSALNSKYAIFAQKSATVTADLSTLTGATVIGIFAGEGAIISATTSKYRRSVGVDDVTDAQVLSGGVIRLNGATGGASQKTDVQLPAGIIYKGLKTKSKGGALIAAGQTSVTVSHTLSESPIVLVTPITSIGSATKWWVSNVDATSFKINIDATTSGAVTFHWSCELI